MDLDRIYKEQLPVSHVAGLQAVFQAGVDSVPVPEAPAPEPEAPAAEEEVAE